MARPVTPLSFTAITLGLRLEELAFAVHAGAGARYQGARGEVEEHLRRLGLTSAIPADPAAASDRVSDVLLEVAELLGRQRESGEDRDALPFFVIATTTMTLISSVMRGDADNTNYPVVAGSLEALGLDLAVIRELERDAGLVRGVEMASPLSPEAVTALMSGAAQNFLETVVTEYGRGDVRGQEIAPGGQADSALLRGVSDRLVQVQRELADTHQSVIGTRQDLAEFLAVYQASNQRLEDLVRSGDRHMEELLRQIAGQMVQAGGVDATQAQQATAGEPSSFFARLTRWLAKGQPIGPVESALWAALDFVPGGTGVKLGIAVIKAVRESLQ